MVNYDDLILVRDQKTLSTHELLNLASVNLKLIITEPTRHDKHSSTPIGKKAW